MFRGYKVGVEQAKFQMFGKPYFQHFFEHALVKGKSRLRTPIERFTPTDSSLKSDSERVSAPSETR